MLKSGAYSIYESVSLQLDVALVGEAASPFAAEQVSDATRIPSRRGQNCRSGPLSITGPPSTGTDREAVAPVDVVLVTLRHFDDIRRTPRDNSLGSADASESPGCATSCSLTLASA